MSVPYFLTPNPASGTLDGDEAQHAFVKRIEPGERIALTDGVGTVADVIVRHSDKQQLRGDVTEVRTVAAPEQRVTLVQAVPKSERAELAVDLAVQGGVDAIVPWISHRTIARWPAAKQAKQVEKWQHQAIASAKQARRAWVPQVADPVTTNQLKDLLAEVGEGGVEKQALVLHEDAAVPLTTVEFGRDIWLIVGPEGGIGEDELELIGARAVTLGPEVLRTASAGFAALCAIGALTTRW